MSREPLLFTFDLAAAGAAVTLPCHLLYAGMGKGTAVYEGSVVFMRCDWSKKWPHPSLATSRSKSPVAQP